MADSNVAVTAGAGTLIDTQTTSTGEHRQVIVIGDPATDASIASVVDVSAVPGATVESARDPGSGDALNVNINAVQLPTYKFLCKPTAAALTANAIGYRAAFWHAATSTRGIKIRSIEVNVAVSALAQSLSCEVHMFAGAVPTTTTGTTITTATAPTTTAAMYPLDRRNTQASEASGMFTTGTAAITNASTAGTGTYALHLAVSGFIAASSTAALHGGGMKIYDWQEGGPQQPITLRAGVLEGIQVGFISSAAPTITPTVEITFTEV